MRIVFMGTPDFAVPTLAALDEAGHTIPAVYTQPPRKAGRGKKLQRTPIHEEAEIRHIEVRHPESLRDVAEQARLAELEPDLLVVAAHGLILPQAVLDIPARGALNVHASLLPKWRGAAPIQRAIMAGDSVTGITIMQMEAGLDTGPMLATARVPIENRTAGELTEELAEKGAQLMAGTLRDLDLHHAIAQDDKEATYAKKIDKREARLDWTDGAVALERKVRAFAPFPGAWFEHEGERFKVLAAEVHAHEGVPGKVLDDRLTIACSYGALRPTRIQRAGRPAMDTADLLRGRPIAEGTRLP